MHLQQRQQRRQQQHQQQQRQQRQQLHQQQQRQQRQQQQQQQPEGSSSSSSRRSAPAPAAAPPPPPGRRGSTRRRLPLDRRRSTRRRLLLGRCGSTRRCPSWPPPLLFLSPLLSTPPRLTSYSFLQIAPPSTGTRSSTAFAASLKTPSSDPSASLKTPSSDPSASLTFSSAVHRLSSRPHPITLANLLSLPALPPLSLAANPELQAAADATFLHNRREYLILKADHDVAVLNYEFASSERATRLELIAEYNTSMAAYVPNSIAWAAADNRACTILLGALPDALMRRFQAHEMRAHLIWTELQSMFERRDISSVGVLFQEYFSITLATCDGAVDYVGHMQEVADRLAARQAALFEPLQIHRLLFNLTPDYESRLHAGLRWIIDTEVKFHTPIVNLTTSHSSSTSLNATQPRTQGGRNGGGGGRGGGGGGSRVSGRGGRGGSGGGGGSGGPTPRGSSSAGGAVSRSGGRHGPHAGTPCGQTNHPPTNRRVLQGA
ncbi:unnamed protein product [Closterium sp. NIES-53]